MESVSPGIMGQIRRFSHRVLQVVRAHATGSHGILVVAEIPDVAIVRLCERLKMELNFATNLPLALDNLHAHRFDVVIYDQDVPQEDWRTALPALAEASPRSSILLLSTLRQPDLWHEVIRRGGHDMLIKPVTEEAAESTVALAVARARLGDPRKRHLSGRRTE